MLGIKYNLHRILCVLPLLIFSGVSFAGLSASTANTIQGTGPVLDPTLEASLSNNDLFGFTYEDTLGTISPELYGDTTVSSITFLPQTVLSKFVPVLDKNTALTAVGTLDNDGDTVDDLVANNPTGLTIKWFYDNAGVDTVFTPSATDSFCSISLLNNFKGPYKLEISGDLDLKTQYGDPSLTTYTSPTPTKTYTFNPTIDSSCIHLYAQPNLAYGTGSFAGPAGLWNSTYGFFKQSSAVNNFPSTGFPNAKFSIAPIVVGNGTSIDSQYSWSIVSQPGALLTIVGNQIAFNGSEAGNVVAARNRVLATGGYPVRIKGTHSADAAFDVEYEFNLTRWFVTNGVAGSSYNAESFCKNVAGTGSYLYRLATPQELSNSSGGGGDAPHNGFSRKIGALFSEWGATFDPNVVSAPSGAGSGYASSSFLWSDYWTMSNYDMNNMYTTSSPYGNIEIRSVANNFPAVCISDPLPTPYVDSVWSNLLGGRSGAWIAYDGNSTNGFNAYKNNVRRNFPTTFYKGGSFQLIIGTRAANQASLYTWSITQGSGVATVNTVGLVTLNGPDTNNLAVMKSHVAGGGMLITVKGTRAGYNDVAYQFILRSVPAKSTDLGLSSPLETSAQAIVNCASVGWRLPYLNEISLRTTANSGYEDPIGIGAYASEWQSNIPALWSTKTQTLLDFSGGSIYNYPVTTSGFYSCITP